MQPHEIRLECLRLAHRPGLSPHEVIATAREYLGWVDGVAGPTTPARGPGDSSKVSKPAPSDPDRISPLKKQTAEQSAEP
jgi:hypothetical protein